MAKGLVLLILALWGVAIAILSVQNATPVSLRFLGLRSIEMPFGIVLSFFAAIGLIAALLVSQAVKRPQR